MITNKIELMNRIKKVMENNTEFQVSYLRRIDSTMKESYFHEVIRTKSYKPELLMEIMEAIGTKNQVAFTKIEKDEDGNPLMTFIIDFISFDLEQKEIETTNLIPSETQTIHDLYKNQLNWYIEQTKLNEERLDKRLKEIMKSQNLSSEIDAQKIDFSGILPHIMPVLEVLKNLGSK